MFGIVVAGLLLDREKEKDAKGMSRECEREQIKFKINILFVGGGRG